MIFIYNQTNLAVKLKSVNTTGEATLHIMDQNDSSKSAPIIKATNTQLIEVMNSRYQNGHDLTHNPSREYLLIKNSRILIDSETDEYVVSSMESGQKERPKNLIKNLLVMVMHKEDRFVVNYRDLKKKPVIHAFGDEYIVVIFHIKSYNWSNLSEPMKIYIKPSLESSRAAKQLEFTYAEVPGKDDTTYRQNVINVTDYEGTIPEFKSSTQKKPYNKQSDGNNRGGNNRGGYTNNRNTKPSYGPSERMERGANGKNHKELVIPKYQDCSSRTQGGRKKGSKRR